MAHTLGKLKRTRHRNNPNGRFPVNGQRSTNHGPEPSGLICANLRNLRTTVLGSRVTVHGYTLVELTVVVFLIGTMLTLAVPRIQDSFLSGDEKSAARRLIGTVTDTRERAIREKQAQQLHLDISADRMWVSSVSIPAGEGTQDPSTSEDDRNAADQGEEIPILDVDFPLKGKETVGEVVIHFTKNGYIEPAVVHLGTKIDDAYTVHLSPFLGVLGSYDEYVESRTLLADDA